MQQFGIIFILSYFRASYLCEIVKKLALYHDSPAIPMKGRLKIFSDNIESLHGVDDFLWSSLTS